MKCCWLMLIIATLGSKNKTPNNQEDTPNLNRFSKQDFRGLLETIKLQLDGTCSFLDAGMRKPPTLVALSCLICCYRVYCLMQPQYPSNRSSKRI